MDGRFSWNAELEQQSREIRERWNAYDQALIQALEAHGVETRVIHDAFRSATEAVQKTMEEQKRRRQTRTRLVKDVPIIKKG